MRKALYVSIAVCILAVAAYFTKPSEKACIDKATKEFRTKISYTVASAPKEVEKNLFAETLEKSFLQKLRVADKFLYRDIYQETPNGKSSIGWAAFGSVNVEIK